MPVIINKNAAQDQRANTWCQKIVMKMEKPSPPANPAQLLALTISAIYLFTEQKITIPQSVCYYSTTCDWSFLKSPQMWLHQQLGHLL